MLASIDPGDRIPEGFSIDDSLDFAGKAIEEVAHYRWLMAEELVLLLMMPQALRINYLTNLPSADAPLQGSVSAYLLRSPFIKSIPTVGKIYLISGDSKQSMFDGIEYEKRQTEDRANTQSGIYSQLSINKQQIIEGVYSTTSSSLRRRYYYMRDENERFRKVVHYRYITESELQEATNRREGKKKASTADLIEEDAKPEKKERKTSSRGTKSKRGLQMMSNDDNDFGAVFDVDEELESPTHHSIIQRRGATGGKVNPNKTIPIHYSVLYNCYKYLFYKHLELKAIRLPSKINQRLTNTNNSSFQFTYVKGEDDGGKNQFDQLSSLPLAIQFISPNNLTHHSLKYTQHCSLVLNGILPTSPTGAPVEIVFEKIFHDPSMIIPGANIPIEESRVKGVGKQLTENVYECVITPALSAGRWRVAVIDPHNQVIAFSQSEESLLTIIEESKSERFESLKRRRQKSKSEDYGKKVDDTLPHSTQVHAPWPTTYPYRLESEQSMMMTEAYTLLLQSRGNSIENEMQMDNDHPPAQRARLVGGIASTQMLQRGSGVDEPADFSDPTNVENMQALFVDRSWNVSNYFATGGFHNMDSYSYSETDSLEVSSGSNSATTTDGENGADDRYLDDGERDEIVRILEHGMSIEGEMGNDQVDRNHY